MVGRNIVTNEAQAVAREIEDQLQARDLRGLGFLSLAAAGGVLIAQEVTERVLPMIFDGVVEPASPTEFAAAGAIKLVLALVLGAIAASMGGLASVVLAVAAFGSVVFGGSDFVNAIQRSGVVAEATQGAPAGGGSGNSQRRPAGSPAATADGYDY